MLINDLHVRAMLLSHVCTLLGDGETCDLREAGLSIEEMTRLRELSAFNVRRLAAMYRLRMEVRFDADALRAGLRSLGVTAEIKALELYFLRNGASWALMRSLFKVSRRMTYRRRRQWDAQLSGGNVPLPPQHLRRKIFKAWRGMPNENLRMRYYYLHRAFPQYSITALEKVVGLLVPRR